LFADCLIAVGSTVRKYDRKARPAKSEKKITGPKPGLNEGCFAIVSYTRNKLGEMHRLATFGKKKKKKLPVKEKWPFGAGQGCTGRATQGFHQT
jgi:hypothetical protein